MSDIDKLMREAQVQLDEHAVWLIKEIAAIPTGVFMTAAKEMLAWQATQIKLRVARVDRNGVSIVWDYPDELLAFLQSPSAPKRLRESLAGAHVVSIDQPASTVTRVT